MYCPSCGKEIPNGSQFCPSCGKSLGTATTGPVGAAGEKKKRSVWKIVGIVLGAVIAFVVAVVIIAFWATSGIIVPVERQLAALKRGDIPAAYAETASRFREATPIEKFEAFVKRFPGLSRNASYSFSQRSVKGATGQLKGTLTDDSGGVLTAEYRLVKEQDAWKILFMRLE